MALLFASEAFMTPEEVRESGACDCIDDATDDDEIQSWIDASSDMIASFTGMRVSGEWSLIARPCRSGYEHDCACDCCHLDAIPMGEQKPTITQVLIDGTAVPAEEYELHWQLNGWNLVRVGDGVTRPRPWPSNQHRWKGEDQAGTFAIHYTVGVPVDQLLVRNAVLELVCQFAAGRPDDTNVLPKGVVQAQLGGGTVTVDPGDDEEQKVQPGAALAELMAVFAPLGRETVAVYSPELTAWDMGVRTQTSP